MITLVTGIGQLATATGPGPRRGTDQGRLQVVEDAAMAIESGRIIWVGRREDWSGGPVREIDLGGRAVVPGLVDPHTHAIWAGDRLADFDARANGVAYEEILRRGGGIRSTMRKTAAATVEELAELAAPRLARLVASGATTIEVKSGYGFTAEAELRMLEAIRLLAHGGPAAARPDRRPSAPEPDRDAAAVRPTLVPTLLIHVPPGDPAEREAYLTMVTGELIPEVARRGLATAVDVFVEREAFTLAETEAILNAARERGLKTRLHADQFHALGGIDLAVRLGALSVDHLEASGERAIATLATGDTIATLLPGVTLHLGLPAAPGRAFVDAGVAVAVGTDLNPGSSPLYSTAMALALAVRLNGLTPAEALTAATANAAAALGLDGPGRLEAGCPADFAVLRGSDWREIAYDLSGGAVAETWIAGAPVQASGAERSVRKHSGAEHSGGTTWSN